MIDAETAEAAARRQRMVEQQIVARGVRDPRVLAAMATVPRHRLVPADLRAHAYADGPLPLGHGQTISQPYIVAVMSELAAIRPGARVLEIGTGSGYQTAILCAMGAQVWSVEIVESLHRRAAHDLAALGYRPALRLGDGWSGWPEAAPFDAIVVAAAPAEVPPALIEQLTPEGRLVIPVGVGDQELQVWRRGDDGAASVEHVFAVRFVPMTGQAQDGDQGD